MVTQLFHTTELRTPKQFYLFFKAHFRCSKDSPTRNVKTASEFGNLAVKTGQQFADVTRAGYNFFLLTKPWFTRPDKVLSCATLLQIICYKLHFHVSAEYCHYGPRNVPLTAFFANKCVHSL